MPHVLVGHTIHRDLKIRDFKNPKIKSKYNIFLICEISQI
jgi:hypothetical protein